jgi:hypothetical protein
MGLGQALDQAVQAKSSQLRTTAFAGEFNRSMQHTGHCVCRRSVADEVPHTHVICRPQPDQLSA